MTALHWSTARQLRDAVGAGEISCQEIVRHHLNRIEALNPALNAFLTVTPEGALKEARRWDAARAQGEPLPPLAGVPVVLKDNLCTRGVRTTCGSRILETYAPPYDATAVERLRAAGAIILGKANMDEFAMGSSTENSAFGPSKNPWDTSRVPGGSSGGSAAAVAAGLAPLALGSDTGGSVKQPAALCGLVGMRPTYGRVSRHGLVAFASSLDQVGPFSRTVEDNLLLLSTISGHDPRDSTSAERPALDGLMPDDGVAGLRVGLPKEHFGEGVDPEAAEAVRLCARLLEAAGARVEEVSLPHDDLAVATYYVLADAEASSNLARYDGIRYGLCASRDDLAEQYEATRGEGFGAEVKRRVLLGTFVLSSGYYEAYYGRALSARALCRQDFEHAFERVDLLLGPTSPTPAFSLGAKVDDPLAMYLSDVFTIPSCLGGFPGLSFPCGFSSSGLPLGAQLVGPKWTEGTVYRAALHLERVLGLTDRHPEAA